jgi:hypothetical protein
VIKPEHIFLNQFYLRQIVLSTVTAHRGLQMASLIVPANR